MLLERLCLTLASVEITQKAYDSDPIGKNAAALARQLTGLNSSAIALTRQLRLNPMQSNRPDAPEQRAEPPAIVHDRLIGGHALRSPPR
jgi:hypothetical protein